MTAVQFVVGEVMPLVTLLVLFLGLISRLRKWTRAPAGKITLYPSAKSGTSLWGRVAGELLLFRSLWTSDRSLWAAGWVFHVSLALIVVGHARVFTDFPRLWTALGMSPRDVDTMSATVGGALGVMILVAAAFLLARRSVSPEVRDASKLEDYGALLLLLGVIVTGDAMRFLAPVELEQTRAYFRGLLAFTVTTRPEGGLFWSHFLLVQLLIMYIPLGKLLHAPGVFFSHPLLRRD